MDPIHNMDLLLDAPVLSSDSHLTVQEVRQADRHQGSVKSDFDFRLRGEFVYRRRIDQKVNHLIISILIFNEF